MICVRNVTKYFDRTRALDGFDMTVKQGSVYGLVGTNGAGKTTILKLIAGVLRPDCGDISIAGEPVFDNEKTKNKFAFIPDDLTWFEKYTPKGAAKFYASVYDRWDGGLQLRMMDEFGLSMNKPISELSKGMQKQAVFALTLATQPEYLLLDEPVDGLDPIVRKIVWNYIVDATAERGMTTLVSSHNLREMEGICDSIGIIDHGRMVVEKDLDEMRTDIHKVQISFGNADDPDVNQPPKEAYEKLNILHREQRGAVEVIILRGSDAELEQWNEEFQPMLFDVIPLTLEEIFIHELGGTYHEKYIIL